MNDWLEGLNEKELAEWQAFVESFRREAMTKIAGSAAFISITPDEGDVDVKFAVELGTAIMLNKPIAVLAMPGRPIPDKLRQVADLVIEGDMDTEEGQAHIKAEMQGFIKGIAE